MSEHQSLYNYLWSSLTQWYLLSLFAPVMGCGCVNLLSEEQGVDI